MAADAVGSGADLARVSQQLADVAKARGGRVPLPAVTEDFKRMHGAALDYKALGFKKLQQLIEAVDGVDVDVDPDNATSKFVITAARGRGGAAASNVRVRVRAGDGHAQHRKQHGEHPAASPVAMGGGAFAAGTGRRSASPRGSSAARGPLKVDMQEVNERVKAIRLGIHRGEGGAPHEQVRLTTVVQRLCGSFGVTALKEIMGLVEADAKPHFRPLDINLVDELRVLRLLEGKIDTYIRAYTMSRQVCTLHSLDLEIAAFFSTPQQAVRKFSDLQMGPLTAHRLVREKFVVNPRMDIPELSEADVYDKFWEWKQRQRKRGDDDLHEFLVWLAFTKAVATPEKLGLYMHRPAYFIGGFLSMCGKIHPSEREVKDAWLRKVTQEVRDSTTAALEAAVAATADPSRQSAYLTEDVVEFLAVWRPQRAEPLKVTSQALRWALTAAAANGAKAGAACADADIDGADEVGADASGSTRRKKTKRPKKGGGKAGRPSSSRYVPPLSLKSAAAALAAFLYTGGEMPAEVVDSAVADFESLTEEQLLAEVDARADELADDQREGLSWLLALEQAVCSGLGVPTFESVGRGPFVRFLADKSPLWLTELFRRVHDGDAARVASGDGHQHVPGAVSDRCVPSEAVHAAIETALLEIERGGDTLRFLHRLEKHVCQSLGITSFGALGHGASFVGFLLQSPNPAVAAAVNAGGHVPPRAVVLRAAAKLADIGCTTASAVETALCEAFAVQDVASLGCASVGDMLERAAQADVSKARGAAESPDSAASAEEELIANLGLICPRLPVEIQSKHKELDFASRHFAVKCVLLCPHAVDIGAHLHWRTLFEPYHGSLPAFCRSITPADCSVGSAVEVRFVQPHRGGPIAAVDRAPSTAKFAKALEDGDPALAAAQLVALLVAAGGVGALSTKVIETYVESFATAAVVVGDTEGSATFFLRLIGAVPEWGGLRAALAPIVLDPLRKAASASGSRWPMETELLRCASGNDTALHAVLQSAFDAGSDCHFKLSPLLDGFWALLTRNVAVSTAVAIDDVSDAAAGGEPSPAGSSDALTAEHQSAAEAAVDPTAANTPPSQAPAGGDKSQVPPEGRGVEASEQPPAVDAGAMGVIGAIRSKYVGDLESAAMGQLRKALQRISTDLYSEDTHFVLELIQNADDNTYRDGVSPELQFTLSPAEICVANNEVGFQERHVRALCGVGESTKGTGGVGFIGQKGIGFKSVFTVSDAPEIHSGGFHFALDRTDMIVPMWLDGHPDDPEWTRIRLPLNTTTALRLDALQKSFCDPQKMSPLLLLFLKKLRTITIIDRLDLDDTGRDEMRRLRRVDRPGSLVELHDGGNVQQWFVVRRQLSNLPIKRSGADSTEVAIAVPIDDDVYRAHDVFSFLPVDDYGFKFVVQADFILTSSRERVTNNGWNEQIRDHLHELYLDVLRQIRRRAGDDGEGGGHSRGAASRKSAEGAPSMTIARLLQRLPLEADIKGFFKPVATRLRDALRVERCIPTQDGPWCPVTDVVRASEALKRIVSPRILLDHLGKRYLRADVDADVDRRVLDNLGVGTLTAKQLVKLLECVLHAGDGAPDVDAEWAGRALSHLHREGALTDGSPLLDQLKQIRLLPLVTGEWVSAAPGPVFLTKGDVAINGFEDEVPIVSDAFFGTMHPAPIHQALRLLGVNTATPNRIVERHIARRFADGPPSRQTAAAYLAFVHTHFADITEAVKLKLSETLAVPVAKPKQVSGAGGKPVWRWVANGVRAVRCNEHDPEASGVYFAAKSAQEADRLHDWSFENEAAAERSGLCAVDLDFLAREHKLSRRQWQDLLAGFGVHRSLVVARSKWSPIVPTEQPWAAIGPEAVGTSGLYGRDFTSVDIERALLQLTGQPLGSGGFEIRGKRSEMSAGDFERRCRALDRLRAKLVDNASRVLPCLKAECAPSATAPEPQPPWTPRGAAALGVGGEPYVPKWRGPGTYQTPSTVAVALRQHAWLVPQLRAGDGGDDNPMHFRLFPPAASFFPSDEVRDVGGGFLHTVAVADGVSAERELWEALGVRTEIDGLTLLELLRRWAAEDPAGEHRFRTSVYHFQNVLKHVQRRLHEADTADPAVAAAMRAAFRDEALVWLPDVSVERRKAARGGQGGLEELKRTVDGKFWRARDLTWSDPSEILDYTPGPPRICGLHYTSLDIRNLLTRSMCFTCRQGGYGTKGAVGCVDCQRAHERYEAGLRQRLDERGESVPKHYFACVGSGTSLVAYMPTVEQYITSLGGLTAFEPREAQRRVQTLLKVLSIGVFLQEMPAGMLDALPRLFGEHGSVFPAMSSSGVVWASSADALVVNDDVDCAGLFTDVPDLRLLPFGHPSPAAVPVTDEERDEAMDPDKIWSSRQPADLARCLSACDPSFAPRDGESPMTIKALCVREAGSIRPLLRLLGVRPLSACVTRDVRPQGGREEAHSAYQLLPAAVAVAQRWLMSHDPDAYAEVAAGGRVTDTLSNIQVITVDAVVVSHRLRLMSPALDVTRDRVVTCHFLPPDGHTPGVLYVRRALLRDDGFSDASVWRALASIVLGNRPSEKLTGLLEMWGDTKPAKRSAFLLRQNVPKLPEGVAAWTMSPPTADDVGGAESAGAAATPFSAPSASDGPLETFSGGFDKRRKRQAPEPTDEPQQFPAPQHLETVVAEEDGRIRHTDVVDRTQPAAPSNLIFPETESGDVYFDSNISNDADGDKHGGGGDGLPRAAAGGAQVSDEPAAPDVAAAPHQHGAQCNAVGAWAGADATTAERDAHHAARASISGNVDGTWPDESRPSGAGGGGNGSGGGGGRGDGVSVGLPNIPPDEVVDMFVVPLTTTQEIPDVPVLGEIDDERAAVVGRYGEQMAHHALALKAADGTLDSVKPFSESTGGVGGCREEPWSVHWVNEDGESGLPFDIVCTHPSCGTVYVEVKATATAAKAHFEISTAELMLARQLEVDRGDRAEHYVIVRVYVGTGRLDLVVRPWRLLETKGARLFLQL